MKTPFLVAAYILLFLTTTFAQHQETNEKPVSYKGAKNQYSDTNSLLYAFKTGQHSGHFRSFFMATDNQQGLTDYFAQALGGGLHYNTAVYRGFQFGISGFYIFNVASSNLAKVDTASGQSSRYEIGLFDQENFLNKSDIDRLEELFLKYHFHKIHVTFGRQLINTPFINLQDGRMRPTGVEGLWFTTDKLNKTKLEGGWLYAISPRGSTKWFGVGESIGFYPSGVNPDGSKSNYHEHLESNGVGMLGITHQATKWLKFTIWEMYADNLFNSALFQLDMNKELKANREMYVSGQFIRQDAINDGGNADQSKTYFSKNGKAMTFGARVGIKSKKYDVSLNFNRITSHGRYLMPREWGRDPFFTFMPRERNEGLGNSTALVLKSSYTIPKSHFKTALAAGYVNNPDVTDAALNKYAFPSYFQINLDVRYTFDKFFKGLDAQFLIASKFAAGETYGNARYIHNKVNLITYNFLLNYHF